MGRNRLDELALEGVTNIIDRPARRKSVMPLFVPPSSPAPCPTPAPGQRFRLAALLLAAGLLAACGGAPARPPVAAAPAPAQESPAPSLPSAPTSQEAPPAPPAPVTTETPTVPPVPEENRIHFAFGATAVDAAGRQKLLVHAARLKADRKLVVTLVGHTDHLGSSSYNLAIAEQRAAAVAAVLLANGATRLQVRRYGIGNEKADDSCRSAECRRQMRRVDLIYGE